VQHRPEEILLGGLQHGDAGILQNDVFFSQCLPHCAPYFRRIDRRPAIRRGNCANMRSVSGNT